VFLVEQVFLLLLMVRSPFYRGLKQYHTVLPNRSCIFVSCITREPLNVLHGVISRIFVIDDLIYNFYYIPSLYLYDNTEYFYFDYLYYQLILE